MIRKIATLCFIFMMPFLASAASYTEGKQYTQISDTLTSKAEVREYFSFYCPHCMKFEPIMEDVKKDLPNEVSFQRNHVDFLRAASPEIQFMLSKAIVVAQQLNMEEKLVGALFNYIQIQHATITAEKDIRNIFVLNGADGDKFDGSMKSFSVNSQAKQMKKRQDDLAEKRVLTGVPTIIVNGKYRVNLKELDGANLAKDFKSIVDYLLTLDK